MPITATRLPVRSRVWSQRAVCTVAPPKESTPSMSGGLGTVSTPLALNTNRAVTSPPGSSWIRHSDRSSSNSAESNCGVEPDFRPDPVLVGAMFGVGLQFAAARVGPRPVRPLLERVLIRRRRNVHGDTGIGVPVPGSADFVTGLDDEVVAESLLVELDRGADAGEPRANDQTVVIGPIAVHRYLPREPLQPVSRYRRYRVPRMTD